MSDDRDIAGLSHSELVALVRQLRQQVTQQEQEIAQLKGQKTGATAPAEQPADDSSPPGSREDLLAQLDKMYPEG